MSAMDSSDETEPEKFRRRKKLPHTPPHWVRSDAVYFITINCETAGKPSLCSDSGLHHPKAEAVINAAKFYHDQQKWFVRLFLVMPDHVHALLTFASGVAMKPTMTAWKGYLKRFHRIDWQSDFFDHRIRNQQSLSEKFHYIRMNPVRKGFCTDPREWPHQVGYHPMSRKELALDKFP